jgi:putative ABC transport system permease protein
MRAAVVRELGKPLSIEEDGKFKERLSNEHSYYAEPSIFKIFSIPIVAGDIKSALEKPFTMMVSGATAEKYFGTKDVVGRQLKIKDVIIEITGVYKAFPEQSHWHPDILVSFSTLNDRIWGRKIRNGWSEIILVRISSSVNFDRKKQSNNFQFDKHMGDKILNCQVPGQIFSTTTNIYSFTFHLDLTREWKH